MASTFEEFAEEISKYRAAVVAGDIPKAHRAEVQMRGMYIDAIRNEYPASALAQRDALLEAAKDAYDETNFALSADNSGDMFGALEAANRKLGTAIANVEGNDAGE